MLEVEVEQVVLLDRAELVELVDQAVVEQVILELLQLVQPTLVEVEADQVEVVLDLEDQV
jgi:hypothetical protein